LDKERIKLDQEQSKNKKSFVNKKSGSEAVKFHFISLNSMSKINKKLIV